jgi:ubiquinone/menaquinone biosynthesis C-methylase UbiE
VVRADAAAEAQEQYGASTRNLDSRVAIHSFGSSPLSWPVFVRSRLPLEVGAVILDVGAGTGIHWREPTAVRPVLLDLHAPMCHELRQLRHPVVQASAEMLPMAGASFDGVLCTHALYHVPDPERAIAELFRVVRPGGWIALSSNGPRHMAQLSELRRSAGVVADRTPHSRFFGIEDAVRALTARGLRPVTHEFSDDLKVTDASVVLDYCASLGPLTPEQERRMTELLHNEIAEFGHYRIERQSALIVAHT